MTKQRKRRHESGTPEKEDGATEELKAFIEEKTGEAVTEIKKALDQRISGLEDSLNFAYESIAVTSQKVSVLEKELKAFNDDWQDMKYRIAQLEQEREEAEKLRRRSQLVFTGRDLHIPENDDRLVAAVSAQINRLLELDVPPGEIVDVKRLPRKRLLVKFARDERGSLRDAVYRAKHKLRGQHFFINENLTPVRQEVLNLLLHERREGILSTVLTRGGEVLFAVSRNDRLIRVRSKEEAINILRQIRFTVPEPTCPVEPGIAPAPDPVTSRAPEQTVGPPTEAGSLIHRGAPEQERVWYGRPPGIGGAERPPPGLARCPGGPAGPASDSPARLGEPVSRAGPRRRRGWRDSAGIHGGGGADYRRVWAVRSTARPSGLAPPLTGTAGRRSTGGPED